MEYKINNWSVRRLYESPYLAPECNPICLVGLREGEEHRVRTSPIVEADGKKIKTKTGSIYILGDPDPDYIEYLKDNNIIYNKNNPIKMV